MSILPQAEPTLPTPSPRIGDWIHTLRGPFWPLDPRPEEIHVEVIARGLSCETRFAGQGGFYSVAQHVVHVVELLESWGEDRLTEARDLLGVECIERWDSLQGIEPHRMQIAPWSPEQAERRFLAMFAELTGGAA